MKVEVKGKHDGGYVGGYSKKPNVESRKIHKFAHLYPTNHSDEDDVQGHKPEEAKKKSEKKPYELVNEAHMPKDAVVDEDGQAGQPADYDPEKALKQSPKSKRRREYEGTDPRCPASQRKRQGTALAHENDDEWAEPKPFFEELIPDITQWVTLSGKDFEIFPFHVMKCSDYLWLCMGKRRTGKTTL